MAASGLVLSKGEARRAVEQGGVKVDGEAVKDIGARIAVKNPVLIQKGKRNYRRIVAR